MTKKKTPKQILAGMLRRKKYRNCHGQTSSHGCGEISIQIFDNKTGKCVCDCSA